MRIDELTRELHAQADEAMSTATVRLSDLRARRRQERRRLAVAGAAVAVLVTVAGVALLDPMSPTTAPAPAPGPVGRPSTTGSSSPEPSPSESPAESPPTSDSADASDWQPVECNEPQLGGCEIPATLTYRGHTYTDLGGASGSQQVLAGNGVNRELRLAVVPAGGPTLVLVGATDPGPGSKVGVSVNWALTRPLPDGPLSPLLLKRTPDSQTVVVVDDGTPGPDEVLHIATYTRTE